MNPAVEQARSANPAADQQTIEALRLLSGLQPPTERSERPAAGDWSIRFSAVPQHPAEVLHQLPLATIANADWQQIRQLRDTLWDAQETDTGKGAPLSLIGLTGLIPARERWAIAAGLWASHREWSGCRVLLIDADPYAAPSSQSPALALVPGLLDVAMRTAPLSSALQRIHGTQLYLMGPGKANPASLDPIDFRATRPLFEELRRHFDFVFLHLPDHESATDLAAWARHTDGTILSCRRGQASFQELESLLGCIPPSKALGWVVL